jgi:regulatory protein
MTFPKKNRTKPVPDEKALYEIAVRALAGRARSTGEMRQLLGRRKAAPSDIDAVISRLRDHGYLDDARFARAFVAARIENDKQGALRVRRDLAARRVHPEVIQKAVGSGYDEVDERELLRNYLRQKVRLTKPPEKPSAVASLYRRLLRAGFSSATIVKELHGLMRAMPRRRPSRRAGTNSQSPAIDPEKWQEWVESLADLPEPEE